MKSTTKDIDTDTSPDVDSDIDTDIDPDPDPDLDDVDVDADADADVDIEVDLDEAIVANSSKKLTSFKSSNDIENMYRYIYNNDLRREAKFILQKIHESVLKTFKKKGKKLQ